MHITVGRTAQPQHCSSVLMLALQTAAVLLLIGIIPGVIAIYTTGVVHVSQLVIISHTLYSTDNVAVRDIVTCFTEFSVRVA